MGKTKINYEGLLKIILDYEFLADAYGELVDYDRNKIIIDNPYYKKLDESTKKNVMYYAKGNKNALWEQSPQNDSFLHVHLNLTPEDYSIFRLYMCPRDEYLYPLVNELIVRYGVSGEPINFKYSRRDRLDKIVMYPRDAKDTLSKIKVLGEIKKAHPEYFKDMRQAIHWLFETDVEGVYLAPERQILNSNGEEYSTYSNAFTRILMNVQTELLFHFCKKHKLLKESMKLKYYLLFFEYYCES